MRAVHCAAIGALFGLPAASIAADNIRHYLGYADETLVALARASGADPSAAIGAEIPQGVTLRVPSVATSGGAFKVQLWMEYLSGEDPTILGDINTFNVAYDRALGSSGSGFRIDEYSFQKLAIGRSVAQDCLSNFGTSLCYTTTGLPVDANGDGFQDTGTLGTILQAAIHSTYVPGLGVSVRPYGLTALLEAYNNTSSTGQASRKYAIGEKQRLVDLEFRSLMTAGETYGFAEGETGLTVFCDSRANDTRVTGFSAFGVEEQNIGSRYNLLAVPEPTSMIAVLVGFGVLVRRRK